MRFSQVSETSCWRSPAVEVKGQGEGQPLANCFAQAVLCVVEAFASGCSESRGLLSAQAQPLSEESLCRQQAFATSCAKQLLLLVC